MGGTTWSRTPTEVPGAGQTTGPAALPTGPAALPEESAVGGGPGESADLPPEQAVPGEPAERALAGEPAERAALPEEPADPAAQPPARAEVAAGRGRRRWLVPPTRRPCKLGEGGYAAWQWIMPGSVIRTCVGCGMRAAKSDLLRVVAVDGEPVADPSARRPGRGAYLHPSRDCLEPARRPRAMPRALRATGPPADGGLVRYLAET